MSRFYTNRSRVVVWHIKIADRVADSVAEKDAMERVTIDHDGTITGCTGVNEGAEST
jgi:hypothetical protein